MPDWGNIALQWFGLYEAYDEIETARIEAVVTEFPSLYKKAIDTWIRFEYAYDRMLLTTEEILEVAQWFKDVTEIWDGISPNWEIDIEGNPVSPEKQAFKQQVDNWVATVRGSFQNRYLGFPAIAAGWYIVGAVIVVLGVYTLHVLNNLAEATKEKAGTFNNLLTARTEGKINESELKATLAAFGAGDGGSGNWLDDIGGIVKTAAVGLSIYALLPVLKPLIEKLGAKIG